MHRPNKTFTALGAFALLLALAAVFAFTRRTSQALAEDIITISSPVVPVLEPHEHRPGDSLYEHAEINYRRYTVPEDLWLLGSSGELKNVPNEALHHSHLYIEDRPSDECLDKTLIAGRSTMTNADPAITRLRYSPGYGIFLKQGTPLLLETVFHLPLDPAWPRDAQGLYRDASFALALEVAYAKDMPPGRMKPLQLFFSYLGDEACEGVFRVPAHSRYVKRSEDGNFPTTSRVVIPEDGAIVMLHGHYHPWDGGRSLRAFLNGNELFEFLPAKIESATYGTQWVSPRLWGNPWLWRVKQGDVITYEAIYENAADAPIEDAMATLYVYFAPNVK